MARPVGQHPPLACRPSPPQGGEIGSFNASPFLQRQSLAKAAMTSDLPLEGEMSGRTEGCSSAA
ncbi:MAG: hypothetical protein EOS14_28080 [Mesorhizobium sp.]|nr:MAG: hypothetical protein EOS14_28080 [Mesorhizobium sp.]